MLNEEQQATDQKALPLSAKGPSAGAMAGSFPPWLHSQGLYKIDAILRCYRCWHKWSASRLPASKLALLCFKRLLYYSKYKTMYWASQRLLASRQISSKSARRNRLKSSCVKRGISACSRRNEGPQPAGVPEQSWTIRSKSA